MCVCMWEEEGDEEFYLFKLISILYLIEVFCNFYWKQWDINSFFFLIGFEVGICEVWIDVVIKRVCGFVRFKGRINLSQRKLCREVEFGSVI